MTSKADKTKLLRQLIPKAYHFDGYSEINCPNPRDKPFFADNDIPMGEYYLSTRLINNNTITIQPSSPCQKGNITFSSFTLTLDEFAKKIREAVRGNRDHIYFEITPKYIGSYNQVCKGCNYENKDCIYLRNNQPSKIYAAISFHFSEMKEALAMYFEITTITNNGGKTMLKKGKNNFLGMNFEFGISKDSFIASTLMGLAVKNKENGNWYVFDTQTLTRKNIANIKMGNFPVMYVPTNKLVVGKLYKINNQYVFVQSINADGTITLIGAADGLIQQYIPEKSLFFGANFYTEVVAFDAATLMDQSSGQSIGSNVMAAILMMQWSKGDSDNAEFSLDNINDESFNGLGAYLPFLLASGKGDGISSIFGDTDSPLSLPMLMALGSDGSDNSGLTQMLVLSQILKSGENPISNMLDQNKSVPVSSSNKVKCSKCGNIYDEGTNFCPKCGGKTVAIGITCHKCGTTLMEGAAFCHKCGTKVGTPTCSKCGATLTEETNFCPKCGTPVNQEDVVETISLIQPSEPVTKEATPKE